MRLFLSLLALVAACYAADEQLLSVYDLLKDGEKVEHIWMELGYATLNDIEWTDVETTVTTLNADDSRDVSVFLSLPDYGGPTHEDGWPMVPKLAQRAQKTAHGSYKFSAILVQPNDSYCPKLWWTPVHTPPVSVGWLVVEEGVYNVSNTQFVIDSGPITRNNSVFIADDTPALYHAKTVFNYTTGCDSEDPDAVCTYIEKPNPWDNSKPWLHLGAIQQLQTSVNKVPGEPDKELYLSVRARHVFSDRIVLMLMTHSVWQNQETVVSGLLPYNQNFTFPLYPDYEDIHTPEIVSYFVWERNLRLKCIEGLVMETNINYESITNTAINVDFYFKYSVVPGLFGMLGTLRSVADSTVLRVFNRTTTSASFITQEDQCTDEEQKHTTQESGFGMVVGESPEYFEGQPMETECFIVYDKQPCVYDILLVDTFGDGWGNNYFEVVIDGVTKRFNVTCGSRSIQLTSKSCEFYAQMKCDGECKTTWENYWEFSFRGVDHYGDYDSTLHVKDIVVTVTDPVDVNPNSKANACEQCKIAPPLPNPNDAKNGKDNGNADGSSNTADLLGENMVPGVGSGGMGTLQTLVVGHGVFFRISVGGIGGTIQSIGFYEGAAGANGNMFASIGIDSMSTLDDYVTYYLASEEEVNLFLSGGVYCVVHTTAYPDGELRGQVSAMAVGSFFELLGANEVPAVESDGSGVVGLFPYMEDGEIAALLYSLEVNTTGVTNVTLNMGMPGEVGDVLYNFDISTFGTHTPDVAVGIVFAAETPQVFANMNSLYCNVLTSAHPSGELRGNVFFSSGNGDGNGKDGKAAPAKPKAFPIVIELFESGSANGWYDNSGLIDDVMTTESTPPYNSSGPYPVPRILTYPQYTIANADNTKLIHTGSICVQKGKRAAFERCEEIMPPHGEFIFRVTGWVPEGELDSWKFCGVTGHVGQELQFEMVKGKCVAVQLIDAPDLCSDGGSVVTNIVDILFSGVVIDKMTEYDTLIAENEVAEVLPSVLSVSVNNYKQTSDGLVISFGVSVAADRYGVDGSVVDNISGLVTKLHSTLEQQLSKGAFLSSGAKVLEAGYPESALFNAKSASLVSMRYVDVKYLSPLPADKVVSYPAYNKAASTESVESPASSASFPVHLSSVAAVAGVAVFIAFAAIKIRGNQVRDTRFESIPTSSEHSVDLSEDRLSPFDLGMETSDDSL